MTDAQPLVEAARAKLEAIQQIMTDYAAEVAGTSMEQYPFPWPAFREGLEDLGLALDNIISAGPGAVVVRRADQR